MDTRRRSDSRERLAASPSTDPQPVDDDLGSETRVVRLSDGQPVSERRAGIPPTFIVGMVAVAILGFALGAESRNLTASASPGPSLAAVASASPFVAATATGAAGPSRSPVTTGVPSPALTAKPTAAPPSAWTRMDLAPDFITASIGAWGVGRRIIVVGRHDLPNGVVGLWSTVILEPGRAWRSQEAPRVIEDLSGGTVIDGRLTFLARTTGIDLHRGWQIASTADGDTWDALAPVQGLGDFDSVQFLARGGSTWIVSTHTLDASGNDIQRLARSSDGVHWTDVSLPDVGGIIELAHAATLGDTMLLSLRAGTSDENREVLLTSQDGITWRAAALPASLQNTSDLACSIAACVLTGFEFDVPSMPAAWITTDGTHWAESSTQITDTSGSGIAIAVPTAAGFLGYETEPRLAWLSSPDAATWRSFEVLPADMTDSIYGLAVANQTIVAVADGPSGEPVVWRGALPNFPN